MNVVSPDSAQTSYDVLIIGAGFYGCVLAAHLSDLGYRVLLCEAALEAMTRASAVNQARVHTGFHYPRSFVTSLRSLHNQPRFVDEYRGAVVDNFQMLYAIAKYGTKVNVQRFYGMYKAMNAPIEEASAGQRAVFDSDQIDGVFACTECAFDYQLLRSLVFDRLLKTTADLSLNTTIKRITKNDDLLHVELEGGQKVAANRVFNVTYAQLNSVLIKSGVATLPLKHELVELALVRPPPSLTPFGITVMDGAFFSCMPYPSRQAYSLTHVRYTPHLSWSDNDTKLSAYEVMDRYDKVSRWKHMINDSKRYVPAVGDAEWLGSMFDIKTVPIKSEHDDGRPILLHGHLDMPGLWSILGSKIDNIYDVLQVVK